MITLGVLHRNNCKLACMFIDKFFSSPEAEEVKLIWIDNDSNDDSADHVSKLLRQSDLFIKSNVNLGVIGGRNKIFDEFDKIESTHLIFLDNDQLVSPGWLNNYKSHSNFENAIIGLEAWQLDNNFKPFKMCNSNDGQFSYVGCGGMCIPKDIYKKLGKFDDKLGMAYFEDPDYCFRAFESNIDVKWKQNKYVIHLAHQTLGKMNNRGDIFSKSAQYFRSKWRGRKDLLLRGKA